MDLLISGGNVIDPGAGLRDKMDVAVDGGRITAVEPGIDPGPAAEVVDATGLVVLPGLIDLHTHSYWGATFWGIRPDPVAARSGVTTWVDAGSAGAYNLPGLIRFIAEPSAIRLRCFVNISCVGLTARTHEVAIPEYCDVEALIASVERYRETVAGVKVRISRETIGGQGVRPLERAVEAAERLGQPVMVHIGQGPPELEEVLVRLRPGDVVTHCFTGRSMSLTGSDGRVREAVLAARQRGVLFDLGHGSGSFTFASAEAALSGGFAPDVVSSDIHQLSVGGPVFDLPTCMNKLVSLGADLEDVITATTRRPAEVLGMYPEIGSLRPGARADVALFALREGGETPTLYDVTLESRPASRWLEPVATIAGGRRLTSVEDDPPQPWVKRSGDWQRDHLANNRRRSSDETGDGAHRR
ncbi:MAG TPA: amidohydrolase/deacetylase family metallohydrolase [Candidatus Dormibacteraeota bacterium]|nr:amidohydrolase/deacetylase family metallohydrolase [Candidatus Dormibacteraeota bacterium]